VKVATAVAAEGVWFSVSSNGKSILGDGGAVGFGKAGDEEGEFYVGTGHVWEIAESRFEESVEGDGWQLLARVRSSPAALRDEALARWGALESKVIAALERGEVVECVGEIKLRLVPEDAVMGEIGVVGFARGQAGEVRRLEIAPRVYELGVVEIDGQVRKLGLGEGEWELVLVIGRAGALPSSWEELGEGEDRGAVGYEVVRTRVEIVTRP
jgi:hypothetical protein